MSTDTYMSADGVSFRGVDLLEILDALQGLKALQDGTDISHDDDIEVLFCNWDMQISYDNKTDVYEVWDSDPIKWGARYGEFFETIAPFVQGRGVITLCSELNEDGRGWRYIFENGEVRGEDGILVWGEQLAEYKKAVKERDELLETVIRWNINRGLGK